MALAIWLYLLAGRGAFWLAGERDEGTIAHAGRWPAIAAVIPARDEADCVGETVASLLRQDYPGAFTVILVDDQSRDGTAQVARDAAAALDATARRGAHEAADRQRSCWAGACWRAQSSSS